MARTLRLREKPRRRPHLKVESLEDRSVPATDITVTSDVFTVTNGADESIALTLNKVGDDYILLVVGSTFNLPVPIGGVSLSDGDQTLTVDTDDVGVNAWSFLLGNLADSLTVGVGTVNGFAPVTVAGGVGVGETDQLTIDDSANATAHDLHGYGIDRHARRRDHGQLLADGADFADRGFRGRHRQRARRPPRPHRSP